MSWASLPCLDPCRHSASTTSSSRSSSLPCSASTTSSALTSPPCSTSLCSHNRDALLLLSRLKMNMHSEVPGQCLMHPASPEIQWLTWPKLSLQQRAPEKNQSRKNNQSKKSIKQNQLKNQSISTYIVKVQPSCLVASMLLLRIRRQRHAHLVEEVRGISLGLQRQAQVGCCWSRCKLGAGRQHPPQRLLIFSCDCTQRYRIWCRYTREADLGMGLDQQISVKV